MCGFCFLIQFCISYCANCTNSALSMNQDLYDCENEMNKYEIIKQMLYDWRQVAKLK